MRIAIASVMQESNSFALDCAPLSNFSIQLDYDVVARYQGTNTEIGGFLDRLRDLKAEVFPLMSAWDAAAGPVEDGAFEALAALLLEQVSKVSVDAFLIALHGAWLSPSYSSADAELMRRLRSRVGRRLPIVVSLDYHANVRPSLLQEVDAVVGYRTYPHLDMAQTGSRAAEILFELVRRETSARTYWLPIPFLAPAQTATTDHPAIKALLEFLNRSLDRECVLSNSFFCVQPWLDIPAVASSIVVVARSESSQVPGKMRECADEFWKHRAEFEVDWVSPEELIARIIHAKSCPVIVSEAFDGTSGGASGEHPGLLSIMYPHRDSISACLFVVDAQVVESARHLGVGGRFVGLVGAKRDTRFGAPIRVEGTVRHLSNGEFILKGPVATGRKVSMGPTAVLEVGRLNLVVATRGVLMVDPELYRSQQIEPAKMDVVGIKSPAMYRPGYASLGGTTLDLDMPGVCRGNLRKVPFSKITRPIYPLDDFAWEASKAEVLLISGVDRATAAIDR